MFDYTKDRGQKGNINQRLIPHPDGMAWPKCCKSTAGGLSCAFVRIQDSGARLTKTNPPRLVTYDSDGQRFNPKTDPFLCCHRSTDDGYYRVCAGWDACFGNKAEAAKKR